MTGAGKNGVHTSVNAARKSAYATLVRLGGLFLLLASLWKWFVHPAADSSDAWVDGICGLLYGLSIGMFLMSIKIRRRVSNS